MPIFTTKFEVIQLITSSCQFFNSNQSLLKILFTQFISYDERTNSQCNSEKKAELVEDNETINTKPFWFLLSTNLTHFAKTGNSYGILNATFKFNIPHTGQVYN